MPAMDRGHTHRISQHADIAPGHDAIRHRRVRWAERGGANFRDRSVFNIGEAGKSVHITGPPLIGAHAGGGVTFQMFDRAVALARRQLDIRHRDVVVKINKAHLALGYRRQTPHRVQRFGLGRANGQSGRRAGIFETGLPRRLAARPGAAGKASLKGKDTVRSPRG